MIKFFKAEPQDAEEVVEVKIDAFEEDIRKYGLGPDSLDNVDVQRENIKKFDTYKIMDGEKIIGGITCREDAPGKFWIGGLYIIKAYQNKGIGAQAIEFIEKQYSQAKSWGLQTPYLSFRNHHFYEKMGYVKVGETEPDKEKNGFHSFVYEKVRETNNK